MATIYLKAAGGNFNGANWSATGAAGVDSLTPTAADDCIVELASGALTINSGSVCRSLDFTSGTGAYTNTATHTAGVTLTIGDGTAGAGNVALKLAAGMTYTLGNNASSAISLASTSTTQQTVTTNGKTTGSITVGVSGAPSYLLGDALTSTGTITHAFGIFNSGNFAIGAVAYSTSNSNTRTITWGSSALSLTSNNQSLVATTTTNLTVTANTAVITCTSSTSAGTFFGSADWNGLGVVFAGANSLTVTSTGATIKDLTRTNAANKTADLLITGTITVSGTLTVNSQSVVNRILVAGGTRGTAATITAAAVVLGNVVDFMDITGAGAATWTAAGTGATAIGDCGGNSGITFTGAATQTATGTASFTASTHGWTSRVPLPQDDVVIPNAFVAGRTVTLDMPRMGKNVDLSGSTGAPSISNSVATEIYGSLTYAANNVPAGTSGWSFAGRSNYTVTSAGVTHTGNLQVNAPSGTYVLADAVTTSRLSGTAMNIVLGTLDNATNNVSVTFTGTTNGALSQSGGTLNMGSATWSFGVTSAVTFWSNTGGTVNCGTSTILLSAASTSTRTFTGGTQTYNILTYTVAGSTGQLTVSGAGATFKTINFSDVTNARTLALTNNMYIQTWNINGTSGKNMSVVSSTGGTQRLITCNSLTQQTVDFVTFQDIWQTLPYKLFATNSTDTSNNRGISFAAAPSAPYIRQSKVLTTSGTSHAVTLDNATVSGDLLVLILDTRADPGTVTPPTDFVSAVASSNTARALIYYKVSDGTETTLTTTTSNSLTNPDLWVYAITGFTGTPTLDVTATDSGTGVTTDTVGTVTNNFAPAFAIGTLAGNGTLGSITATLPTNSWQEDLGSSGAAMGTGSGKVVAIPLTATASQTSTLVWTSSRTTASGMAIFYGVATGFQPKILFM
jgi:hypothetical protein